MPGNEFDDRVHNFFPQENLPQGLHHSPSLDSNWPVSRDSPWAGSQRQVALESFSVKNYDPRQSDTEKGEISNHLYGQNALKLPEMNVRPEFGFGRSPVKTSNVNGFLTGDTNFNQHDLSSRGIFNYGLQQASGENQSKSSVRVATHGSSVAFDLFGGQKQMNNQQLNMLQSMRHQLSGMNDVQQPPHQVLFMKMQEFQRQQQLQQVDGQQQDTMNQIPSFSKQTSSSHSLSTVNGFQSVDGSGNNWTNELSTNWLQRDTSSFPRSSNVLVFSPNHSPASCAVDVVPQRAEQSLYGVPISGSRGSLNQYSSTTTDKSHVQQLAPFGNTILRNQFNGSPVQNGISFSKQRFQVENSFGPFSGQALSPVRAENSQQGISLHRNSPQHESHGMQLLDVVQDKLPEKAQMRINSSEEDVALDPTEERILFSSDDNIWAAFGKSQEDGNSFDGGAFSRFASFQSGTWSALMQSAVAETCSADSGSKEEWSGLNFQAANDASGNQNLRACSDVEKQPSFAGGNLAVSSLLTSGFVAGSSDPNIDKSYQNVLGFQLFGGKGQVLHANSPKGLGHASQDGGQWSNGVPACNFLAEPNLMHRNAQQSLDVDLEKSIPGTWRPENRGSRQIPSKQDGCNAFGSVTSYRNADVVVQGDGNTLQLSWGTDRMQVPQREVPNGGAPWRFDSAGDPIAEPEQVKPSGRNAQVNNQAFVLNNPAIIFDSSTTKTGEGTSRSYVVNSWNTVDPVVHCKGNETVRSLQHASVPLYNDLSKRHEMENGDNHENSNDNRHSILSHYASAGSPRENVISDAVDSRTKSTPIQNYNQIVLENSAPPCNFQYHPMGDVDNVEASRGIKQPALSQSVSHFAQANFFGRIPNNFIGMGKGQPPDHQMSSKAVNEVLSFSQGMFTGSLSSISAPLNRAGVTQAPNKACQSSQNMLELFHKVDQSGEHGAAMHANSSQPSSSSELPEAERSDGSVGRLQRSLSSHSQGFNLQLGPPSQRQSIPNHTSTSQSNLQMTKSIHSGYVAAEAGQDGSPLSPPTSARNVPSSSERSQRNLKIDGSDIPGQLGNEVYNMPRNFLDAVNYSFLPRGHVQILEAGAASVQVSRSSVKEASKSAQEKEPCIRPSSHLSGETSLPNEAGSCIDYTSLGNAPLQWPNKVSVTLTSGRGPLSGSLPPSIAELSSQGSSKALSGLWTNIVAHQHLLGAQFRKQFPPSYQTRRLNSQGVGPEEEQSIKEGTDRQLGAENIKFVQENASQGKEHFPRTLSDEFPAILPSTQRDIEAFGHTLKPNNCQQNVSLLNPTCSMPDLENDPSRLALRRMKGQDNSPGVQLVAPMVRLSEHYSMTGDAIIPPKSVGHSEDPSKLNFSGSPKIAEQSQSLEHGNVTSQGLLAFGHDVPQSINDSAPVKVDHSKISPQMAPSWLNHQGVFRNGQILPLYDSHRAAVTDSGEQPFTLGKSSSTARFLSSTEQLTAAAIDVNKVTHIQQSAFPSSVAMEHFSSQILPTNVNEQYPVILRNKKRKSATSELVPWYKEVSQGSRNPQTISMAEVEWSKAANRLTHKAEEDVEFFDDGPPMFRSKRRLILSMQFMQQLLCSPPAAILSMDANSDYETVTYFVSRLALGEACSMVSHVNEESNMKSDVSTNGINRFSGSCKTSDRLDRYLFKVAEEFTARARKLESDFLRLDKGASLLDLIVEYQDLEKFSVINRFAKFHGRGQAENAETASSSNAVGNIQKPFPQRYVTALPLPGSLPIGVQCHSL